MLNLATTNYTDHNTAFEMYASVDTLITLADLGFPTPISGDTLTKEMR